jgi:UDP-glucose 4-epimerase
VDDVVAANLVAAATTATGPINIGTGVGSTVLDIVSVLSELTEAPFEAQLAPARPGEVQHIALDVSRARGELEWQAAVALSDGLGRTLDSLR